MNVFQLSSIGQAVANDQFFLALSTVEFDRTQCKKKLPRLQARS